MIVADEDVAKLWPAAPSFTWVYDITNEAAPTAISTFQVEGLDRGRRAAGAVHRLSPTVGAFRQHGPALRLVRPGSAPGRFR